MVAVLLGVLSAGYFAFAALASPPVPAPSITAFPPNPSNSQSASFTYTDSVAVTKFQCSLDGSAFADCGTTRPSSKTYNGLSNGSHTFQVRAVSGASTSSATSYVWVVDRTAPTVLSINRVGASPTNAVSVQWTVTFSEPVTGVASNGSNFSLVASGLTGSPAITPPVTGSGAVYAVTASTGTGTSGSSGTLQLRLSSAGTVKDAAGNGLAGVPFNGQTYVIDKTPPPAPSITSGPLQYPPFGWPSASASFQFTDSESGVSFLCSLDAGVYVACSSPKTYTGLAQGPHTLRVEAKDAAGNVSGPSAPWTWFVDTVAPNQPTLTSFPPDPSSSQSATFAWTDTDPAPGSGIAAYACKLDGGSYQFCSSPKTYTGLSFASHTFSVVAVDWAGNISQARTYTWTVSNITTGVPFTIAGNATGLLYPGAASTPIALTITNPNNVPIYVTSVTVTVTNDPNGCTNTTNILVTQSSASGGTPITVPANAVNYAVPAGFQPKMQLKETGVNQNICQNQTFSLSYTGNAHS